MVDSPNALAFMIISPIAVLSDIFAIVIISHYYPFFHGTDVMMTSLLCAMAANAIFVLPIPAYLELNEIGWSSSLCMVYVWCFITFRMIQMLSLVAMSVQWSTMLKMSAEKKKYFSTKTLRIVAIFIWLGSAIVGLVPIIGAAQRSYNKNNHCHFLGFNLGIGFAIFFLIFNIAAMFVSVICASDATFLIKHMRKVAEVKYKTGRFYLPEKRAGIPSDGNSPVTERYHRLNFAWDLCKFVLIVVLSSFLISHFPYAVIEGAQVFSNVDRGRLEVVVLWLVGVEALLLPHALWLLSRRYRHALVYILKVYILRRTGVEEEDPFQCTLQSYTQKERDRASTVTSRAPSIIGQNGGHRSASGTLRSTTSELRFKDHIQTNGQTGMIENVRDFADRSPNLRKQNGVIHGEVHVERVGIPEYMRLDLREREVNHEQLAATATPPGRIKDLDDSDQTRKISEASSIQSQTSSKGSLVTPRQDVTRSSSGCSRKDWKEQMRKKHLPPIFVNEGFDGEDAKLSRQQNPNTAERVIYKNPDNVSNTSLHYYMSSDYHPDYLTDSLPRHRHQVSMESESEGISGHYEEGDIAKILDEMSDVSGSNRSSSRLHKKDSFDRYEINTISGRPMLGSFGPPKSSDRTVNYAPLKLNGYPLSERAVDVDFGNSVMREEKEIDFNNTTLPLDEIEDGYNSLPSKKRPQSVVHRQSSFDSPHNRNLTRSSFQGKDVVEATTSFGRNVTSSSKINVDLQSTGSFAVSENLDSSQTSSDSVFNRDVRRVGDPTDVGMDRDRDDTGSGGGSTDSSSSVTLSPYKGERRRPPWMTDADSDPTEAPLVEESDTDVSRESSNGSGDRRNRNGLDGSQHSGMSTPVSTIFDEDTDRGFEEALEAHVNPSVSVYGGVGLCFESIKEEPEDLTSSSSNPFLEDISGNEEESFKTLAVVSRRSDSRSTSSSTSISDNPLHSSPSDSPSRTAASQNQYNVTTPVIMTTDNDTDFGDSGFTSGMDISNINTSGSSQFPDSRTSGKLSPWPDSDEQVKDVDHSFESDFFERQASISSSSSRDTGSDVGFGMRSSGGRKKKLLPRGRSLDEPHTPRTIPTRGKSFEEFTMDVKPAYF